LIVPEPLGVCLVIGAWNYPYYLTFSPAVAALAAGNTVVIKPSEISANTSALMTNLVANYFDKRIFTSVEGAVTETTKLLNIKFDKIFFTGSTRVGKIVYASAAKQLTPVTLELGGKSPAIVTKNCNLNKTVQRLVWAKFFNAGQTCIAPDYVFVHSAVKDKFVKAVKQEIIRRKYAVENKNYVQIINDSNVDRLKKLITKEHLSYGGVVDVEHRVISPTILENLPFDHPVMQEEIFGPILPVFQYDELDKAINYIKAQEKPLSAYVFSNSKNDTNRVLKELSFGGGCVNDAVMHISNPNLPFGGIGASGIGSYHGEAGFACFSHQKSILKKSNFLELPFKYAPMSDRKLMWVRNLFKLD
jgi:aldehyde dehydrogenase (NAD+)